MPATLAGCRAARARSVTSLSPRAPGHGSLMTLAVTTLVRSTPWLQESWVTHTQRVWQDTKSHQLAWKRMLSANAPMLGLQWHLNHT